jgi:hypothetical protein
VSTIKVYGELPPGGRGYFDESSPNEAWWQDILRRKGDLQVAWSGPC